MSPLPSNSSFDDCHIDCPQWCFDKFFTCAHGLTVSLTPPQHVCRDGATFSRPVCGQSATVAFPSSDCAVQAEVVDGAGESSQTDGTFIVCLAAACLGTMPASIASQRVFLSREVGVSLRQNATATRFTRLEHGYLQCFNKSSAPDVLHRESVSRECNHGVLLHRPLQVSR